MNEQFFFVANVGSGFVLACFVSEVYYSELYIFSGKLYISQPLLVFHLLYCYCKVRNRGGSERSRGAIRGWLENGAFHIADGYNMLTC